MPDDHPYTPAELGAARAAMLAHPDVPLMPDDRMDVVTTVVLTAVLPDHDVRVRAEERTEVAADLVSRAPSAPGGQRSGDREAAAERRSFMRAAGIARCHATTEEDPNAD